MDRTGQVKAQEAAALATLHQTLGSGYGDALMAYLQCKSASALQEMAKTDEDKLPVARARWAQLENMIKAIKHGPITAPAQ